MSGLDPVELDPGAVGIFVVLAVAVVCLFYLLGQRVERERNADLVRQRRMRLDAKHLHNDAPFHDGMVSSVWVFWWFHDLENEIRNP